MKREITVLDRRYEIKYRNKVYDDAGNELRGLYDPTCNTIFIERGLSKEDKKVTVIHEVVHAVLGELKETTNLELGEKIEEQICEHIARALVFNKIKI